MSERDFLIKIALNAAKGASLDSLMDVQNKALEEYKLNPTEETRAHAMFATNMLMVHLDETPADELHRKMSRLQEAKEVYDRITPDQTEQ